MTLSVDQWHQRYLEQSRWTASLRDFVLNQLAFDRTASVLEVGCGTGAVLSSLPERAGCKHFGLDIQYESVKFARNDNSTAALFCADGVSIPCAAASFDICFCHYLLLWLNSPLDVLSEMKRVTRPGGYVAALAEPDYGSRIDHPQDLAELGRLQTESLVKQGAHPDVGRSLPGLFSAAGLREIRFGASGFQHEVGSLPEWFDSEWQVYEHDLAGFVDPQEIERCREQDRRAWQDGSRVLWVPTFYAFGKV